VIYTLDTNIIIDALRQPTELERFKAFLGWALPSTVLSSVVAMELTQGARTPKAREVLADQFLAPFERRGRIHVPSAAVWRRAGTVLAVAPGAPTAARQNDVLVACQARESGWIVITRDADFTALRRTVRGLALAAPYPARP
jgi:predicted nucleic acid-binding protein